jgi:drug/metabolite transporter (DMT)-like permease
MAIRIAVLHMPPLRSVSLRLLLASAVLVPIMFLRKKRLPVGREWGLLFVLSTLMLAISFSLVAWAVQRIPTGTTSLLFATSPLLTAWMEPWLGKHSQKIPVSRSVILGMLGGLVGVALVLFKTAPVGYHLQMQGVIAVLSVVVFGSMATIIAKRVLKDIPVLTISAVETLMAGAVLGVASLAIEGNRPTVWTPQVIWAILFLSVLSSAVGFFLYYWLLMQIEPHVLQTRYLIMPIIAMIDGYLFLHEEISWNMLLGAAAVLGSLAFVLRAEAKTDRFTLAEDASSHKKGR